ncbi:MAG: hypothetical protein WCV59_02615 [Parcubacteria group bacterium]|jgi:hypothetical protein
MHQTFYIDIDEEITSVVERLKKARASEIIMVVPKRALLIQSIINLRLLKKEAEGMGLQLMIVTQDKLGKLLIEKAGILVQQKLDDADDEIVDIRDNSSGYHQENSSELPSEKKDPSDGRLDKLGSDSYFHSAGAPKEKPKDKIYALAGNEAAEKITNKELVTEIGKDIRKNSPKRMDLGIGANTKTIASGLDKPDSLSWEPEAGQVGKYFLGDNKNSSFDQDKKIEHFFHPEHDTQAPRPEKIRKKMDFSKLKRVVLAIVIIAILFGLGVAAYVFIPKADISLAIKQKIKEQDYTLKGDAAKSGIDIENEIIPVKIVEITSEATRDFPTTGSGKKSVSSQKAHGTITIYNEFSSSPQSLVATTRFLSDSGKLFRLVGAVTVPGTSSVNGETKPGAIEAEVAADQAGEDYNIEPTKFSIPGFKDNGNDKYTKIYAKSTKAMSGGGSSTASNGEAKAITTDDIAKAKSEILVDLNKDAKDKISAGSAGMVVLNDAINNDEATYKTSNSVGEVVDKFQIIASSRSQAIVFNEKDLKELISALLAKSAGGTKMDSSEISLEYGKSLPDFKNKTLDIKVHAVGKIGGGIDLEKFKKEIEGKNNDEFESYLSNYPDITKAEVTYWPPFISKIPRFSQRIGVTLDTSQ